MTGLEKVTAKIIADAKADADLVLARADEECAAIRAAYKEKAEAEEEKLREQADRECEALITRARSSAAMVKRNALLEKRAALLDEAYAAAEHNIKTLTSDQYLDLLFKMLRGAVRRQVEGEQESLRLYGEDIAPDAYEILLNVHDRDTFGEDLLAKFKKTMYGKLPDEALAKVKLSADTARISGGLILRCGAVEENCSLAMLFAHVRRETEAKISRLLWDEVQ
jgi:V/A-type H+-transporting ATPase subunit E